MAAPSTEGAPLAIRPASRPSDPFGGEITVVELCVKYLDYCKEYYGNMDGRAVGSVDNAKQMIRRIKEVGGTLPVSRFGPKKLKAFQALLYQAAVVPQVRQQAVRHGPRDVQMGASPSNAFPSRRGRR